MEIDLITFQGPIETSPDITNLERKTLEVAKAQIDAEATPGTFTGPQRLAMIRYRQLKLLKRLDVVSFVAKALVIAEIEKRGLWSTLEGYKTPEQAAEIEAGISQGEYSDIKALWTTIIPYLKRCGISVEELMLKKGANLRRCIPILKSIATDQPNTSERVNRRKEQMADEIREIAESINEPITDEGVHRQMIENLLVLMDGTNHDLRIALDPYAPENARENDPINPQYPCLVIHQNGKTFIVVEVDQDGLDIFTPFLYKRCVVDQVPSGDDPKTYPLVKKIFGVLESNGQHK